MPTYEYRCEACRHEFESFQSITAKPLKKCPQCGKSKLKRLIGTGAGIIFKGSGFYETDYRSDSYRQAEKAEKGEGKDKKTESGNDKKTDGAVKKESPTGSSTDSKKASSKNDSSTAA